MFSVFLPAFAELFVEEGKSRVINVVNLEEQEATQRLNNIGFEISSEYEYSNSVRDGVIVSQEEKKGLVLDEGSTIHVVVSKGFQEYEMPDVINLTLDAAEDELKGMNLTYSIKEIKEQEERVAKGWFPENPGKMKIIRERQEKTNRLL